MPIAKILKWENESYETPVDNLLPICAAKITFAHPFEIELRQTLTDEEY